MALLTVRIVPELVVEALSPWGPRTLECVEGLPKGAELVSASYDLVAQMVELKFRYMDGGGDREVTPTLRSYPREA